jgi:SAM-dependent methyltransferase
MQRAAILRGLTLDDTSTPSVVARQAALYERQWSERSGGAYSPDLLRYRVFGPRLRGRVLDIGAGDGLLARTFSQRDVWSVDLAAAGLRRVAGRAVVALADALPFPAQTFDTIVLSEVLEHVPDPMGALLECRRVCVAGGTFLMSVPLWPLSRVEWWYHRRQIGAVPTMENLRDWDPNHERRYSRAEIVRSVEAAGWDVEHVVPLFGEASSAAVYWLEPQIAKRIGRDVTIAHHLHPLDRLMGRRSSGIAIIANKRRPG